MAKYKMKVCTISGKRFRATKDNFYFNGSYADGFHPYHKDFDNFRRQTGATVEQCRKIVNLVK